MKKTAQIFDSLFRRLRRDNSGAVLVETAMALPILSVLLSGVISYGMYFMTSHGLQNLANEGARASIAGITADERDMLMQRAIAASMSSARLVEPDKVDVRTETDGAFYTVEVQYDASESMAFKASLVPMPADRIVRSATIELPIY